MIRDRLAYSSEIGQNEFQVRVGTQILFEKNVYYVESFLFHSSCHVKVFVWRPKF